MPFAKRSGSVSQIDQKLKSKRQQIIEEERIRVLYDSLTLYCDKLLEKYELVYPVDDSGTDDSSTNEIKNVSKEEIKEFTDQYAKTKPLGF